jgi:hypothetical protein
MRTKKNPGFVHPVNLVDCLPDLTGQTIGFRESRKTQMETYPMAQLECCVCGQLSVQASPRCRNLETGVQDGLNGLTILECFTCHKNTMHRWEEFETEVTK